MVSSFEVGHLYKVSVSQVLVGFKPNGVGTMLELGDIIVFMNEEEHQKPPTGMSFRFFSRLGIVYRLKSKSAFNWFEEVT